LPIIWAAGSYHSVVFGGRFMLYRSVDEDVARHL
jgi:hypothetical protein